MTEGHRPRKFADELVSQDATVSEFDSKEFRMNLEEKLKSIERRAGCVRRASLIASAATIAFLPLAELGSPGWLKAVSAICFFTALITAGVLLSLYWHMYRQAVDHARSDLQLSMIADLQQQIGKLIQRLDDRDK
jgi:hypothetical protein